MGTCTQPRKHTHTHTHTHTHKSICFRKTGLKMLAQRVMLQCRQMANSVKTGKTTGAHMIAIGSGVCGVGGLAYSLKPALAPASSANIHGAAMWPQYVRERLQGTFGYFGSGLAFTALGGAISIRNRAIVNFFGQGGLLSWSSHSFDDG